MKHQLQYSYQHIGAICGVCGKYIEECSSMMLPPIPDEECSGIQMIYLKPGEELHADNI